MSDDIALAHEALKEVKPLWTLDPSETKVTRLGGLTNLVFRVDHVGEQYCLRVPGKGTEEYINRVNEGQAAREAARVGVSPDVIHFNAKSGVMVTRFIDGAVTMSPANFKSREGSVARAAEALAKLHRSDAKFNFRFDLFAMIDDYLKILATKDVDLPEGYHDVVREAEGIRTALNAHAAKLVACHCDPLCENFIDTNNRMWIVDWEYSGMNDPLWDLGDLSVEGVFDDAQDAALMQAYFGRAPTSAEHGRVVIYKGMCDLLWTLWGLIQHANKNPVDDFWAYALNRFMRCKVLMASAEFPQHVAAVRKG